MDFKLCSLLIFLAVFNLTVAVEVRHGDPAITFQSKRDNQSFVGSKVPDASPGYLNVEVKNRGGSGAVKPWPQKFDEARSPRLFETSLVDENVKDGLANVTSLRNSNPPPPDQAAKMARYIVKTASKFRMPLITCWFPGEENCFPWRFWLTNSYRLDINCNNFDAATNEGISMCKRCCPK